MQSAVVRDLVRRFVDDGCGGGCRARLGKKTVDLCRGLPSLVHRGRRARDVVHDHPVCLHAVIADDLAHLAGF